MLASVCALLPGISVNPKGGGERPLIQIIITTLIKQLIKTSLCVCVYGHSLSHSLSKSGVQDISIGWEENKVFIAQG